jgi:ERF superfamily
MQKSESIGNLVAALKAAQEEFAPILKTSENPGFKKEGKPSKYADLATALEATQPSLTKNGLVVMQFPVNGLVDKIGVRSILAHTSGEFISEEFWLPLAKQDAQTGVAAVTYARRASYLGVIGAAAEDDDGNTAAGKTIPPTQTAQNATTPTKAAGPPKAEIPHDMLGTKAQAVATSEAIVNAALPSPTEPATGAKPDQGLDAGSAEMPTEEQFKELRKQYAALCNDLAAAGLKSSKGLPINRKVQVYMLKVTDASETAKITLAKYVAFFKFTDAIKAANGLAAMVTQINEANNLKEEKAS